MAIHDLSVGTDADGNICLRNGSSSVMGSMMMPDKNIQPIIKQRDINMEQATVPDTEFETYHEIRERHRLAALEANIKTTHYSEEVQQTVKELKAINEATRKMRKIRPHFQVSDGCVKPFELQKSYIYRKETVYENFVKNQIVYVQSSDNLTIPIAPVTNNFEVHGTPKDPPNGVMVTDIHHFGSMASVYKFIEIVQQSNLTNKDSANLEARFLASQLCKFINDAQYHGEGLYKATDLTIRFSKFINYEELKATSRLYLCNNEVILSLNQDICHIPHPLSISRDYLTEATPVDGFKGTYQLTIDLVDNEQHIKDRFMYVSGNIVRIKPIEDDMRPNGLYVAHTLNGERISTDDSYFTLDDLEKAHLYSTYEEAKSHGNPDLIIAELKHKKAKAELDHGISTDSDRRRDSLEKMQLELDKLRLEKEMAERKAEVDKIKAEADKDKAKYEGMVNIAKAVAASVSTCLALFAMYVKFSSDKE